MSEAMSMSEREARSGDFTAFSIDLPMSAIPSSAMPSQSGCDIFAR